MRADFDRYREIADTLSRNKSRTFLTGFGVFWGVFMLVTLMGGGQGLKELLNNNFEGFATNSALIWAQPTTMPYAGFRKGRTWCMSYKDVERLQQQVHELDVVTPMVSKWGQTAVYGDKKFSCTLKGLTPDYGEVEKPKLRFGRYINDMDMQQRRPVCVIGKHVYKDLFPKGGDPCGHRIRIGQKYYNVVGVDYSSGSISINGRAEDAVTVPLTLAQQTYNLGDSVHLICLTAVHGVTITSITPKLREVIARAHQVSPDDDKGVMIFNTEVMFGMLDNLFSGVNFLIWLVGIGTLLAGAIGVSNIMMVTVKERTTEIGIRRAIGATPRDILTQIISESVVLTSIAGMGGIFFSVMILEMMELGNTTDGIVEAHFQVGFWSAIGSLSMLAFLGVLAGLAPAARAMAIKPVDAMRE